MIRWSYESVSCEAKQLHATVKELDRRMEENDLQTEWRGGLSDISERVRDNKGETDNYIY
jgi:hypothetical protein